MLGKLSAFRVGDSEVTPKTAIQTYFNPLNASVVPI